MTTNRLAKSKGNGPFQSAWRASEWASEAHRKGLPKHAKAWEEADADGWDEQHFSPTLRMELEDKIAGRS